MLDETERDWIETVRFCFKCSRRQARDLLFGSGSVQEEKKQEE